MGYSRIVRPYIALLASALALVPTAAPAQGSPAEVPSCFAQLRAERDTVTRARPRAGGRVTEDSARAAGGADVVLMASVSAREVRFQSQPRISVRLCGGLDSVRVVERRNLPERIVPGVTYRDVYVAVEILGHVYADCLRAELAGEGRTSPCAAASVRTMRGDTARAAPRRPP
jgi:hypothetical protein